MSVHDKICFYAYICTQRIRYESSINLFSPLSPMETHKIMWPFGGRCKSKTIQSMWRFLQGRKIDQGKKQHSRASFYSSFISAENCLCSGIRRKCARRRARSEILLYMTHSTPSASWVLNLIARLCTVLSVVYLNCVLFKKSVRPDSKFAAHVRFHQPWAPRKIGGSSAVCFG